MNQYATLEVFINDTKFGGRKKISIRYVTSCQTVYFNAQHLFLQLQPVQRCFFDFLVERAGNDGFVLLDQVLKKVFLEHLDKLVSGKLKLPALKTLHNHTVLLVELGLLIKTNQVAGFYINPKYVSVGGASKRMSLVRHLFDLADQGVLIPSPLLDKPIEKYFGEPGK